MADWAQIETEYKETDSSIASIGRRHSVPPSQIRYRADKFRWQRKMLADIKANKREQELAALDPGLAAREMLVKIEAQKQIQVVEKHQKRLTKLNNVIDTLLGRLDKMLNKQDFDGPFIGERESPADVVKKCSEAVRHLIPLERQAFKIKEEDKDDNAAKKAGIVLLPAKKTEQEEDPNVEPEEEIVV